MISCEDLQERGTFAGVILTQVSKAPNCLSPDFQRFQTLSIHEC